jgi:multicomponent Na+:H+ antiporter subunit D
MMASLPPAFVLLASAVVISLLPRRVRPWAFVAAFGLLLTQLLLWLEPGTVTSAGWLGFDLTPMAVDKLSLMFATAFALVGFAGGLYALHMGERGQQVSALVYAGSAMGVLFAGDLLTLVVFWEVMAVASTYLVYAGRYEGSSRAALRYLLVHTVGGALLLAGILVHIGETGSIAFDLFEVSTGGVLVLLGFAFNAAIPPLHAWLPDAYPEGSVTGMVFLSAFTTKTAVYTLVRGFAGWDILIYGGVAMALYGVVYAVLENDTRRLLAYHIVSQVGFMVAAAGIGTEMAVNGAAAHAFAHVLYKGLLVMGAGAVLYATGKSKMTELGGIVHLLPWVMTLYMVGGFAISGFPLLSGYVAKSVVIEAAEEASLIWVVLLLYAASIGTFLHTGMKLPYFTWFGPKKEMAVRPIPKGMYAGMGLAAALCIGIGVYHYPFYAMLPYAIEFQPYTSYKLIHTAEYLTFTALAFWLFVNPLKPTATTSIDTDWFYRKARRPAELLVVSPIAAVFANGAKLMNMAVAMGARIVAPSSDVSGAWERGVPIGIAVTGVLFTFGALLLWGLMR